MARKGYSTLEQQKEATKRYFQNNEEAKIKRRITSYRNGGKIFLRNYATEEDLKEYETLIKERRHILNQRS